VIGNYLHKFTPNPMTPASTTASRTNVRTNVAILGAGYIADFHIAALRRLPTVNVRAVCDLNAGLAQQLADRQGIPLVYGDLGQMLATEPLDVVHVLTPPQVHFPVASQILQAGVDALIEKPLCHTVAACQQLRQLAADQGRTIGVSHNFLYFPAYERLYDAVQAGELGQLDQVDIIWHKPLGMLQGGPFGLWMLQNPTNILYEVCPHSFSHLLDLVGEPDDLQAEATDKIQLPKGLEFYRRWEIRARKGNVAVRLRFSFIDGYPEHYIRVRGTHGSATVDFERNLYQFQAHTPYMLDLDRFANTWQTARSDFGQGLGTLSTVIGNKLKLTRTAAPFQESIARTVASFYAGRSQSLRAAGVASAEVITTRRDRRVDAALGEGTVRIADRVREAVNLPVVEPVAAAPLPPHPVSTVLILGGTGFIGQALVRRLRADGYGVRLLTRNPQACPIELLNLGIEVVRGDFTQPTSVDAALTGIETVIHLARGSGKTWADYEKNDVAPTQALAELCLKHNVKRFVYTSSIAIYNAGKHNQTITENTAPDRGMSRVAPYTRSKVENESRLLKLHQEKGLPVVITRPGVVLGRGGNPYHWGIAAWNYTSVCNLWGNGDNPLPIVLVDDIADALIKAMTTPGIEGRSYNLASRPCISAQDYLNAIEQQARVKIRRVPLSARRMYVTNLMKWVMKTVGRNPAPFPSYADGAARSLAARFDCSKAERELGWQPETDREILISEGIHHPVKEWLA
jgi:nucleoside-diphosphate-sugar epimerase/predicted dehydrogenase